MIKAIELGNGLELKLYDIPSKVAGDRWRLGILARIDIPLGDVQFSLDKESVTDFKLFKESCNGKMRFEKKRA